MSLSDCPNCWNTPCTCGHMGYTTVSHKNGASINMRMNRLEAEIAALKAEVARLASHNRQITKPASCEECQHDYASIACSTCGAWLLDKQRQAS